MNTAGLGIRTAVAGDAAACATIAYAAHARVSAVHNFPSELPTLEIATRFIHGKLKQPRCRGYVAEKDGHVVPALTTALLVPSARSRLTPPVKDMSARS